MNRRLSALVLIFAFKSGFVWAVRVGEIRIVEAFQHDSGKMVIRVQSFEIPIGGAQGQWVNEIQGNLGVAGFYWGDPSTGHLQQLVENPGGIETYGQNLREYGFAFASSTPTDPHRVGLLEGQIQREGSHVDPSLGHQEEVITSGNMTVRCEGQSACLRLNPQRLTELNERLKTGSLKLEPAPDLRVIQYLFEIPNLNQFIAWDSSRTRSGKEAHEIRIGSPGNLQRLSIRNVAIERERAIISLEDGRELSITFPSLSVGYSPVMERHRSLFPLGDGRTMAASIFSVRSGETLPVLGHWTTVDGSRYPLRMVDMNRNNLVRIGYDVNRLETRPMTTPCDLLVLSLSTGQ